MATIKVVNRSASAVFAPEAPYLAAGTMAGAIDLSFSSSANVDVVMVDFVSDARQLILTGSISSSERFNRLSWGKCSSNTEEFSDGIIAGGLVDGNIGLWNPKPLISKGSEAIETALVGNLSRHRGPELTKVKSVKLVPQRSIGRIKLPSDCHIPPVELELGKQEPSAAKA